MPFRDIIGHARLIDLLARSVAGGTLPPSLLLAGPAGIGKRLTAVAVAQALNCLKPRLITDDQGLTTDDRRLTTDDRRLTTDDRRLTTDDRRLTTDDRRLTTDDRRLTTDDRRLTTDDRRLTTVDACGVCSACSRIARGVHPDVLIVQPGDSGAIKVDQVRDIVGRAGSRPFEGRRRAVIVDNADALVPPAQNALLKTLEEPPPSSVFMLVTARPDVLLPTVRSRCPQLRFRPLSPGDLATVLIARGYNERDARAVAATADGSVGRALEASAGELAEARDIAQLVLAKASATGDAGRRLEGAKDLLTKSGGSGAGDREQLAVHLRAMSSLLRDVEVLATRADVRVLANPDVQPELERLTQTYHGERGMRAFTAIDRALAALERNAGVKVVADWLVLQL